MLVELDCLTIFLLRISKEIVCHVLPRRHFEKSLGADSLVNVQGHWINREPPGFSFSSPLQPGLMSAEGLSQNTDFLICEWPLASAGKKFRKLVRSTSL